MERTLTDLVALAKVLYQEEQKAFHAAMEEDTDRLAGLVTQAAVWAFVGSLQGCPLVPAGMPPSSCRDAPWFLQGCPLIPAGQGQGS